MTHRRKRDSTIALFNDCCNLILNALIALHAHVYRFRQQTWYMLRFFKLCFFCASLLHLLLHYNADYACLWGEKEREKKSSIVCRVQSSTHKLARPYESIRAVSAYHKCLHTDAAVEFKHTLLSLTLALCRVYVRTGLWSSPADH